MKLSSKKIGVVTATVATIGIIGAVTAATNSAPAKDTVPSDTTGTVQPTDSTATTIPGAQSVAPDASLAPASKPAPNPGPKKQRTTPSSETISQTEGDSVTVVKYQEIVVDENHSDCLYTYSDGTTYQFQWKTVNPTGGTQTMPDGSTKTVPTTSYNGVCDYSAIGLPKS